MSKAIKRKNGYGMGGTFDQPGYEYDPVNDTFKDIETGKVFSKEYVPPTSGTGTATPTVKLETNKEVSITANGEVEITPTSGKDAMEKVTANVAVPVPVLEDNKTATIDVSTYTEPVEITPTSGKDGMVKATVTLSNIPSGGITALYAWADRADSSAIVWHTFNTAPDTKEEFEAAIWLFPDYSVVVKETVGTVFSYASISAGEQYKMKFEESGEEITRQRYPAKDITF